MGGQHSPDGGGSRQETRRNLRTMVGLQVSYRKAVEAMAHARAWIEWRSAHRRAPQVELESHVCVARCRQCNANDWRHARERIHRHHRFQTGEWSKAAAATKRLLVVGRMGRRRFAAGELGVRPVRRGRAGRGPAARLLLWMRWHRRLHGDADSRVIFSAEQARLILTGRKTQTRRLAVKRAKLPAPGLELESERLRTTTHRVGRGSTRSNGMRAVTR